MTALFISTIQNQPENKGKISVEEIIASVNSEELQSQMKKAISAGIPKKVRSTSSPKEKKLKDENAPKRPKSAYMFFSEKKRAEIREEQPDLKMTEISKVIGERWKEVSPESKAKYVKKAEKDKERYQEELKDYVRPSDEVLLEQKGNQKKKRGKPSSGDKKKRAKKPEGAPKGAKSAYMFFCAAKRDEVKEAFPEYKMTEVSKELGRMWKEDFAADQERAEFVKQAADDKERYAQEKAEWDAANPSEERESVGEKASKASKEKKPKHKANESKPVKMAKAAVESDSDDEPEPPKKQEKTKIVAKPVAKAAAKATVSSDDDSDDEPKTAKKVFKTTTKPPAKNTVQIPKFIGDDQETSSDDE